MIEKLVGLVAVIGLGGAVYVSVPTGLDDMPMEDFAKANGVSEVVLDCAKDVLAGKNVEELADFIDDEAKSAGTEAETATAKALRECVYQDPLGWHGTPFEEYIYLLETEDWD